MEAPGQLLSHYAPRTRLVLRGADAPSAECPADASSAIPRQPDEGVRPTSADEASAPRRGLLAFRERQSGFEAIEVLSPGGDLREAAATLFAKLRRLDDAGLDLIVAEPVPETGLGVAIMDRLRKAAAHG